MKKFVLCLGIGFIPLLASAQEISTYQLGRVVVTATKTEQYQREVGSSITVITDEDLKKRGKTYLLDVLRETLGVSVMQYGGFGGGTTIYLRGAEPGHTLVMIDGVEVNDPMGMYGGYFDFAHILTDDIQKVEIVRGPHSTLYGSDAIGGVVNIITKKGKGEPKWQALFEGGSYNTFKESLSYAGSNERFDYYFSLIRLDSDGISKAEDGSEDDAYRNTSFSSHLGYKISESSDLDLTFRYIDARTDIDDGAYQDDPNYIAWWKNLVGKASLSQWVNSLWDYKLSFSYSRTKRMYRDDPDSVDAFDNAHNWYIGDNKKLEWQNNISPLEGDTITLGFEYEKIGGYENGRNFWNRFDRKTIDNEAFYLQNQAKLWNKLFITTGIRCDDHEIFGDETTYRISTAYIIPHIEGRFKANWGTGFKAPSLFQLYSSYGDINLQPEESRSFDIGYEENFLDNKLSLNLVYFHNKIKNLIQFDMSTWKYKNIGKTRTKGVEAGFVFYPFEDLKIGVNYTYLDCKNEITGKKLARRPKDEISLNINYRFLDRGNFNVSTSYVGCRWDDSANTKKLKRYAKVDLTVTYNLTKNFQIFSRVENLFDKDYMQIRGYQMPGASFYVGVKTTF
ncbi:MAG: hypothetical protein B6D56_04690 [Candidatus Omnitrophica bacterium 4484_70.1]|nr:MAG: hypothetical protein B6D56_04690 [Candidatus Omnitrophica bacterium 4484_70.1]